VGLSSWLLHLRKREPVLRRLLFCGGIAAGIVHRLDEGIMSAIVNVRQGVCYCQVPMEKSLYGGEEVVIF
jgi:hypothetical protein